ncbi:serine/threonine-protein kinase [Stackebrandtia soli]|uniref:serine/threonine-protein kinase n=1 Tax=Stackebrandtia soli TaxID=1892856 RepID=UPI0039ED8FFB
MDALTAEDPVELGKYRLLARLGEGGMGRVYLAETAEGEQVAVKMIASWLLDDSGEGEFPRRFAREVDVMRSVSGPSIALYVDADVAHDPAWLATQYIPGPTLREQVLRHGPMAPEIVAMMGAHLCDGLAALDEAGLLHRDVKPANVMLGADGPRLIDFGLAVLAEGLDDPRAHFTTVGVSVGTQQWMPLEQQGSATVTAAADVYSLGAVLAYAATGRTPARTGSVSVAGLPKPLATIITEMTDGTPSARPSAAEAASRLGSVATVDGRTATEVTADMIAATYGQNPLPKPPPRPTTTTGKTEATEHEATGPQGTTSQETTRVRRSMSAAVFAAENLRSAYAKNRKL